jgi:hypothetical protein
VVGRKIGLERINDLYCLQNIVPMIKSRIMRWVGHVARRGEERCIKGIEGKT